MCIGNKKWKSTFAAVSFAIVLGYLLMGKQNKQQNLPPNQPTNP